MLRRTPAITLLLVALIAACGAGAWFAARPPVTPYLVPGATSVQVREVGVGERLLTFHAPGERYAWYYTIARRLAAAGWVPPDRWGPVSQRNTFTHVSSLSIGYLWEQVELHGEPNQPRIIVRRWMTIPWERYFDYVNLRR
jgi:hypothetical protein